MEMKGNRTVPSDIETTWRALNDPEVLRACIPGCESIDRVSDTEYRLAMTAKVGPVSAKFSGRLLLADIVVPRAYTLKFEGQGGAAGFANGGAKVDLSPADVGTRIDYAVTAQVGGKLAQIGSRLIDGAAAKLADEFFARFVARADSNPTAEVGAPATLAGAGSPPMRSTLRTMRLKLALAAVIIGGVAIYWWLHPA
jgi:hypothetical protein